MSTSIPPSFSYEMLSRLPANSFVMVWKEIRPDQTPQGNTYPLGTRQNVRFVLRGAPNEFAMNTNMYLCGNSYIKVKQTDLVTNAFDDEAVGNLLNNSKVYMNQPYHYFQSSRESFNAGALPYLDNQDITRSHEINNLRFANAKRNRNDDAGYIKDLYQATGGVGSSLVNSGFNYLCSGSTDVLSAPMRFLYKGSGGVTARSFGHDLNFAVPLGLYSNLVNSHSVLPLGLMSSYAVNGFQIELETTEQVGRVGRCFASPTVLARDTDGTAEAIDLPEGEIKDLRIYVPMIRVLDPAVMEAILSLYEKREMVNVGGVQFPLSLRLNSIGYRTSSFPLIQNQSDYFFRITGTDRSVRAYAWYVYKKSRSALGFWSLGENQNICVRRLETMIGTEHVHEVVEDVDTTTNNISNFVSVNAKRSGAMFSPLPQYQEGREFEGLQSDDLARYNNSLQNYDLVVNPLGVTDLDGFTSRNSLCYGVVSMENLDRREGDYSGSFQASGKDLTNVGAIEVRMRLQIPQPPTVSDTSTIDALDKFTLADPNANDYEIVFVYAYDNIMEISPQGVQDITNSAL